MNQHTNLKGTDLLERNEAIRGSLEYQSYIAERAAIPSGIAVVACCDPRCVPEKILGLRSNDRVIVIRTAGTRVDSALTDIAILDAFIGIKEVMIIHHTDCGILHFDNDTVRRQIQSYTTFPGIESFDFRAQKTLEQAMKREFETMKQASLLRQELRANVRGYLFDMKSGKVDLVNE